MFNQTYDVRTMYAEDVGGLYKELKKGDIVQIKIPKGPENIKYTGGKVFSFKKEKDGRINIDLRPCYHQPSNEFERDFLVSRVSDSKSQKHYGSQDHDHIFPQTNTCEIKIYRIETK